MSKESGKGPAGLSRDEVKDARAKARERDREMANFNTILKAVKENPAMCNHPAFNELRSFIGHVTNHPDTYPPDVPTHTNLDRNSVGGESKCVALTKEFASALCEQRDLPNGTTLAEKPVLRVTLASKKPRHVSEDKGKAVCRHVAHWWSVLAVDGDDRYVLLKMNSGLNDQAALFREGCIIVLFANIA